MSLYHFLFTYSVSPTQTGKDEKPELADKVRREIAKIEELLWHKIDGLETAFAGQLILSAEQEKLREKAESEVKEVIRKCVEEHDAYSYVWVTVALMVDGLGEYIYFRI